MSRETVASFTQIRNRLIIYYYTYIIFHEIFIYRTEKISYNSLGKKNMR